jgi:sugar/nucleoside kinase (ribokinase family)
MSENHDCIVCGSCVLDILVRPVPLDSPIGDGNLVRVDPIEIVPGGIVSNAGIALARLGHSVAAMTYTGEDDWAEVLRRRYGEAGIGTAHLVTLAGARTSVTAVMIDETGRRSFAHCVGAPKKLDKAFFLDRLDAFAKSRVALFGYYPLMPRLLDDLPEVFAAIRETGCQTALDAAGGGGGMSPLDQILPHLDYYVPSWTEAKNQTGATEPRTILETYRKAGAKGLLGVKLGDQGALLSPAAAEYCQIEPVFPPGDVVDTTGAGDTFFAGLLCGRLRGLPIAAAGQLAAAVGACCVTGAGATTAIRPFDETAKLAGLEISG